MSRTNMSTTGPTRSAPVWAGDFFSRDHLIPGGATLDAAQFTQTDAVVVTVGAAGAAIDAVSVPVDALSGPIPSGTVLDFGGKKFARLTAAAAAGAVTLTTAALATALVDNDTATYPGATGDIGLKVVPSGTAIGRTIAERDAGTGFGPAAAADDEVFLTAFDVLDPSVNPDVELYRHGSIVKENFLPAFTGLASGVQTKLRALYQCTLGAE
jgi:hypothetical protein